MNMKKTGNSLLNANFSNIITYYRTLDIKDNLWFLIILFSIIFSFFKCQPHISVLINPSLQKRYLDDYIAKVINVGFAEDEWWQFRAKYMPGYFTYNPKYISLQSILTLNNNYPDEDWLLQYQAAKFNSTDYLTLNPFLPGLPNIQDMKIIMQNNKLMIYQDNKNNKIYLQRVLPATDLIKYNGLFDHNQTPTLDGKFWLTTAEITLK